MIRTLPDGLTPGKNSKKNSIGKRFLRDYDEDPEHLNG